MNNEKFSLQKRAMSFKHAFNGFKILIIEEHNFRIHIIAAIIVIILGLFLSISSIEWLFILLVIGLVLTAEALNSVIENIADLICPEKDERIKKIKDISASIVLIMAVVSMIGGTIIFIPKIFHLFM